MLTLGFMFFVKPFFLSFDYDLDLYYTDEELKGIVCRKSGGKYERETKSCNCNTRM